VESMSLEDSNLLEVIKTCLCFPQGV
jgi:hypothetical protein